MKGSGKVPWYFVGLSFLQGEMSRSAEHFCGKYQLVVTRFTRYGGAVNIFGDIKMTNLLFKHDGGLIFYREKKGKRTNKHDYILTFIKGYLDKDHEAGTKRREKSFKTKGSLLWKAVLNWFECCCVSPQTLFGLFEAWKLAIGSSKDRVMWRSSFLGVMKGIQGR